MSTFVYVGKHALASLDLPGRSVPVKRGETFEVDEDEAAILYDTPGYDPVADSDIEDEPEGDED